MSEFRRLQASCYLRFIPRRQNSMRIIPMLKSHPGMMTRPQYHTPHIVSPMCSLKIDLNEHSLWLQLRIKVAIVVAMLFPLGCVLGMFFPSGFSCVVARKPIFGWSLSNLIALLRWNLFAYRNLWNGSTNQSISYPLNFSLSNYPFRSLVLDSIWLKGQFEYVTSGF